MEGNMRGPSSQDCEKSFARTGIPSANMLAKKTASRDLVEIRINAGQLGSTHRRNCMSSSQRQYSDRKYARNFCAA
jgi:hypothetical protein